MRRKLLFAMKVRRRFFLSTLSHHLFNSIVSTLDATKFDIMDAVAREIRGQDAPLGGIQVRVF